jgi:hypothetical protein
MTRPLVFLSIYLLFAPLAAEEKWVPFGPDDGSQVSRDISVIRLIQGKKTTLYAGMAGNGMIKAEWSGSSKPVWTRIPIFYSCYQINDIRGGAGYPPMVYALEGGG